MSEEVKENVESVVEEARVYTASNFELDFNGQKPTVCRYLEKYLKLARKEDDLSGEYWALFDDTYVAFSNLFDDTVSIFSKLINKAARAVLKETRMEKHNLVYVRLKSLSDSCYRSTLADADVSHFIDWVKRAAEEEAPIAKKFLHLLKKARKEGLLHVNDHYVLRSSLGKEEIERLNLLAARFDEQIISSETASQSFGEGTHVYTRSDFELDLGGVSVLAYLDALIERKDEYEETENLVNLRIEEVEKFENSRRRNLCIFLFLVVLIVIANFVIMYVKYPVSADYIEKAILISIGFGFSVAISLLMIPSLDYHPKWLWLMRLLEAKGSDEAEFNSLHKDIQNAAAKKAPIAEKYLAFEKKQKINWANISDNSYREDLRNEAKKVDSNNLPNEEEPEE